jgi:hypothetical protein
MCFLSVQWHNIQQLEPSTSWCFLLLEKKKINEKIPFNVFNGIWIQQLDWIKIHLNCIQIQLQTNGIQIVEECI